MKQYLDFKGFYSIVLISLVHGEYWFIWASVGAPVNTHDLWKIIVGGEMILNLVQQVEDIEIPPLILVDVAFPLWTFMSKAHGDAILPDNKGYFNYKNIPARLVTEEVLGRLKIKCRALFRKCESNKETTRLFSSQKNWFNFGSCVK